MLCVVLFVITNKRKGTAIASVAIFSIIVMSIFALGNTSSVMRAQAVRGVAGRDVNAGEASPTGMQSETTISVSTVDSSKLVTGSIDRGHRDRNCAYYTSEDGGDSWHTAGSITGTLVLPNNGPPVPLQGDPVVRYSANGHVFYLCVAFDASALNTGIFISRSVDNGDHWSDPKWITQSSIQDTSVDKPWLAIDKSESTHKGNVYVCWHAHVSNSIQTEIRFPKLIEPDDLNAYDNARFTDPQTLGSGSYCTTGVGPEGEVYVAWIDTMNGQLKVKRSDDGGNSWGPEQTADNNIRPLSPNFALNCNIVGLFRAGTLPAIAIAPNNGDVHIVWADSRNLDLTTGIDIFMASSTDQSSNGGSWTTLDVNERGLAADQFNPAIDVDRLGTIHIIYYDDKYHCIPEQSGLHLFECRSGAGANLFDITEAHSHDRGEHFTENRVTDVSSVYSTNECNLTPTGFHFIGDYIDTSSDIVHNHPVWTDCRNAEQTGADIYTDKVSTNYVVFLRVQFWSSHPTETTNLLEEMKNAGSPITLGEFKVPTTFDVAKTTNDTKGIFAAASSSNSYDQLAAQLLAVKLNKANEVPSCDKVDKAIDNSDSLLSDANYAGPKTTTTPPSGSVDDNNVSSVRDILDGFNSKGCK